MYDRLKEALKEYGEIMIKLDSGQEAELHLHNTEFIEDNLIKVDADDEVHWIDANKIERYWIHYGF